MKKGELSMAKYEVEFMRLIYYAKKDGHGGKEPLSKVSIWSKS